MDDSGSRAHPTRYAGDETPIVVDLDGTLIRTDLLYESASRFVLSSPRALWRLGVWLGTDKARLKAELAAAVTIDVRSLPFDEMLVAWLKARKAEGRVLVLATASHRIFAQQIADHLGFFDRVFASDEGINLKGEAKRRALVDEYGEAGYDYVANDESDLLIWKSARHAYVVGGTAKLTASVIELGNHQADIASVRAPRAGALIRALRPHQWTKNLLIFIPLIMAQRFFVASELVHAILAFVVFGFTASSVYLLNDIVDVEDDRHHARKRSRPFASGDLSLLDGWCAWPLMILVALAIALGTLPPLFLGVLVTYFTLTLAYSFRLKRSAIVDVLTLATLYTLRIVAGAFAVGIAPSFWLLSFSMFVFLSLAFIKRFSELRAARASGGVGRVRGRGYSPDDLELIASQGVAAGYLSVLVLALYINEPRTANMYKTPEFIWLACPLLLFWISRAWMIAYRGWMHDDPIVFALKDRISWVVGALFAAVFALARMVG